MMLALWGSALLTVRCHAADPLDTWTWRNPLPAGVGLTEVSYLNGKFFALGNPGTLLSSTDGTNWTKLNNGTKSSAGFDGIAYGNGLFVLSGGDGATYGGSVMLTSSDGINWGGYTPVNGYTVLTFANGVFVGNASTSSDGTNWILRAVGFSAVAYGNGIFVGVSGGAIYTSTNGTNWVQLNLQINNYLGAVAYGNGLFVAPYGGGSILTSPNGTNSWTVRASGLTTGPNQISFGNGKFMSISADGKSFQSSTDGIHWTQSPPFGTNISGLFQHQGASSIAGGNGLFVAAGGAGVIATSPDGTNWTKRTSGILMSYLSGIAYGNGRYVAVGDPLDSGPIITSPDGINWSDSLYQPGPGGSGEVKCVTYGNGLFVATGEFLETSPDGINWTRRFGAGGEGIVFAQNLFVTADGSRGNYTAMSASKDGASWNQTTFTGGLFSKIAYGNGQFVAVGGGINGNSGGSILMSSDATNWSELDNMTPQGFVGVAFGNNQFVAVTSGGETLISPDGTSWPLPNGSGINFDSGNDIILSLTFGNGQFVAGGARLKYSSSDGVSWTTHIAGTDQAIVQGSLSYLNGSFWESGNNGAILECRVVPQLGAITRLTNGVAQMAVVGVNARTNSIQASTNLVNWVTLTNVSLTNGIGQFSDLSATNLNSRFYRAVAQ